MGNFKDKLVEFLCKGLKPFFRQESLDYRELSSSSFRLLVLLPCCIGDVLMATPLVRVLREAFPRAAIDFAVSSWARPMLENNPRINELVDCGSVGSGHFSLRGYISLIRAVRLRGYKLAFVPVRSPVLSAVPFLAGVPHRIGLDSAGRGFSLTVRVPVKGVRHEVELYLDLARAIGIAVKDAKMEFFPPPEAQVKASTYLDGLASPPVVIHPGGGVNPGMKLSAKRWPPERFAALADALISDGMPVVLVGGRSDEALAAEIKASMQRSPLDLTGKLNWGELGALLKEARLYIGHDTGATHLAVAVGTPVIALFGPSDPRMYGPYGGKSIILWHNVGCNPCFVKGRWNEKCRDFRCIKAITVDEVLESVRLITANRLGNAHSYSAISL
ncbi:MAG: lipopolysaccharide heptosyltransferase II [Chloroflexi bacterium]|nr:MAG: lipopolysaccharide heptosyltransferase II [Chloroflexota bacterium]